MNRFISRVTNYVTNSPRMCVYIAGVTTVGIGIGILGASIGWVLFVYGMGGIFGSVASYIASAIEQ